jgi:IS30 family transposase
MTPLERGLACAARREGMTVAAIADALRRDHRTLQKMFRRRGLKARVKLAGME